MRHRNKVFFFTKFCTWCYFGILFNDFTFFISSSKLYLQTRSSKINFLKFYKNHVSYILMSVLLDTNFHSWIMLWRNYLKLRHFNFTICGWNPMLLPIKWILIGMRTFAKYYLFLMILQKEIWNFSDFFFGHLYRNERIPNDINNILITLPHLSVVSPLDTRNHCSEDYAHCKKSISINLH